MDNIIDFPLPPDPAAVRAGAAEAAALTDELSRRLQEQRDQTAPLRLGTERHVDCLSALSTALDELQTIVDTSDRILALTQSASAAAPHALKAAADRQDNPDAFDALATYFHALEGCHATATNTRAAALADIATIATLSRRALLLVRDHPPFTAPLPHRESNA